MEARLWSVVIAATYGALLYIWHGILGHAMLDGAIGIVLGLYACSHPASYFLSAPNQGASRAGEPHDASGSKRS